MYYKLTCTQPTLPLHYPQAIATPNYILSPGVTLPTSLVPISAPPSTLTDIETFLYSQNRRLHNVKSDGNCMFRALSHQLYGNDDHHSELRSTLLEVIQSSSIIYQTYWIEDMPRGKVTFQEHLMVAREEGKWGTQVELQAVSDCFNMAVYVCSLNPAGIARWERKAAPKYHDTIDIPPMSLHPTLPFTRNHIELSYSNYHYKSVVPAKKDECLPPPVIVPRSSDRALVIH